MKAVMLSIKPQWCELIANGKKTIEVRKTKPKIETPFKCYIYCSKTGIFLEQSKTNPALQKNVIDKYGGKVIGEFVCDDILSIEVCKNGDVLNYHFSFRVLSCLSKDEICNYIGKGNIGYGWHISDLVIYDKPKELSEFNHCGTNYHSNPKIISQPPHGWCYAEEVR